MTCGFVFQQNCKKLKNQVQLDKPILITKFTRLWLVNFNMWLTLFSSALNHYVQAGFII